MNGSFAGARKINDYARTTLEARHVDQSSVSVVDCDGHLVESITEMAEFMDPGLRADALNPIRNREGFFPSLDGMHHFIREGQDGETPPPRVTASTARPGSGEDCLAFVDKAGIDESVLLTSEGLSVGFIQLSDYAIRVCRAYNDYVAAKYRGLSDRLHPMALIPMQDVSAAVEELRRAVTELGLPGAMLPSTGLPLHLGHQAYWPIYQEASELGCALGVHGGSNRGIGIDSFTSFEASHILHHPIPLLTSLVSLIYHGVLDRYPELRVAFFEGGCSWLVVLQDRMERNEEFMAGPKRTLVEYLASGQILIGCEGDDRSLPYLAKQVGIEAFAYSSDYPHEVDLPAAQRMIESTINRADLTDDEKVAVLGGNARRFFRFDEASRTRVSSRSGATVG
jgi:uncharacterized protein